MNDVKRFCNPKASDGAGTKQQEIKMPRFSFLASLKTRNGSLVNLITILLIRL